MAGAGWQPMAVRLFALRGASQRRITVFLRNVRHPVTKARRGSGAVTAEAGRGGAPRVGSRC